MNNLKTLDKYIIFCFVMIILYTMVHIVIYVITGQEMHVIAPLFFGAFAGEVLMCALLKRLKLKNAHSKEMIGMQLTDLEKEVSEDDVAG